MSNRRAKLNRKIVCAGQAHAILTWQKRLPIETDYAAEIAELRATYPRIGQVLALENDGNTRDLALLVEQIWVEIIREDLDAVVIAISPNDAVPNSFYRRIGFMDSGFPSKRWRLADDEAVELLMLRVADLAARVNTIRERLFRSSGVVFSGDKGKGTL